jgi:hypothetical protein
LSVIQPCKENSNEIDEIGEIGVDSENDDERFELYNWNLKDLSACIQLSKWRGCKSFDK